MVVTFIMFLLLHAVGGSVLGNETVEVSSKENVKVSLEDLLTKLRNGTSFLIGSSLPTLYRTMPEASVNSVCERSMTTLVKAFTEWESWAVKMVDANGKIPSGILEGTVMDFGSMDQCLGIKVRTLERDRPTEKFRGRFCMVSFNLPLFSPMHQKSPEGKSYIDAYGNPPEWAYEFFSTGGVNMDEISLRLGTCVPSTCTQEDIRKISTVVSKPFGFNVTVTDCQVDEPYVWPSGSVAAVCVLGCLAGLCVLGTMLDIICRWWNTSNEEDHLLLQIPKAFSLLANTEKVFCETVDGGCISCFHGIRFLSATWIVLGHTYLPQDTWGHIKYRRLLGITDESNGYLPTAVIDNFTVAVGSFFFMSGFFLVYTTWRKLENNKGKLNIFSFLVHKYWRMTPALVLVLAMLFSLPPIDSGPIWNSSLNPHLQRCRNTWWVNLLYIHNWWNLDQMCLSHTWFVAVLMQLHILGVLLLIVVYRWPIAGIFLGSLTMIASIATTILLVVWNNFPMPTIGLTKDLDSFDDYGSAIYMTPFCHFPTYVIGMVLAYVILKYRELKLAPRYQVLGWTLAVSAAILSVYGVYGPAEHVAVRALYIVGHRIGWAAGIGWLTYACATGNGGIVNRFLSWNAFAPLGHLSYLTYLIHLHVLTYRRASLRVRVYYGHTELVFSFLSTLVVSLFLAFAGYVMVEIPFATLEKTIFGSSSKSDVKIIKCKEDPPISARCFNNINP